MQTSQPYTAWVRIPPGKWFPVGEAGTEDQGWQLVLAWRSPAGQPFDERTVLRSGVNPASKPR
jgi:hypothetical protein